MHSHPHPRTCLIGVFVSLSLQSGDYQSAKDKLDLLDHQRAMIAHWNRRGGFARQYIELLLTFEKVQHGQVSDDHIHGVN